LQAAKAEKSHNNHYHLIIISRHWSKQKFLGRLTTPKRQKQKQIFLTTKKKRLIGLILSLLILLGKFVEIMVVAQIRKREFSP
jgi:hypothetical protein